MGDGVVESGGQCTLFWSFLKCLWTALTLLPFQLTSKRHVQHLLELRLTICHRLTSSVSARLFCRTSTRLCQRFDLVVLTHGINFYRRNGTSTDCNAKPCCCIDGGWPPWCRHCLVMHVCVKWDVGEMCWVHFWNGEWLLLVVQWWSWCVLTWI